MTSDFSDPEITYRKKVERRIYDGKISATGKRILEKERIILKLSETKAEEIIEEALKSYREREQNIQEYKIAFQHEVDLCFPFDRQIAKDLKAYQKILNLQDEDVKKSELEIINKHQKMLNLRDEEIKEFKLEYFLDDAQFNAIKTLESISNDIPKTLPVIIVTGFLGSGKTTLVNKIIENDSHNISILVSDFGEIDILSKANIETIKIKTEIDELKSVLCSQCRRGDCSNSYTLSDEDFINEIYRILEKEEKIDHLIIETSGLANPLNIALTLLGKELRDFIKLDSIITVIDSSNFSLDSFNSEAALSQIQYGDIILLNKTDLVDNSTLASLESKIRELKEGARIIHSSYGQVPLSLISDLTWNELYQDVPQNEELSSISLFSFESNRSFEIRKFQDWLDNKLTENIFRVVGILWFKESSQKHILHISGKRYSLYDDDWKDNPKNQLVFFGQNINQELLNSQLQDCLSEDN